MASPLLLQVSVVFAVAVTKPGHGNVAPLIVGFSLFASAFIGAPLGGGSGSTVSSALWCAAG